MGETCELCGWLAAIVSCISFGTFAVPIKSDAAKSCDVDPLVFQSYKTFMCFVTSFLTLPLFNQTFYFTPWGIVSALFWVPAGVMAIYAVKNAGLAVSQGLWSSIIVLVSFVWGIFVFQEGVKSKFFASAAILVMVTGLWGMSFFSSPVHHLSDDNYHHELTVQSMSPPRGELSHLGPVTSDGDNHKELNRQYNSPSPAAEAPPDFLIEQNDTQPIAENFNDNTNNNDEDSSSSTSSSSSIPISSKILKRRLGLLAAVFNGVWGGSIMVPMHYAPEEAGGTGYVVSFAIGALIITSLLWVLRFIVELHFTGPHYSISRAYQALPSLHLEIMWLPGCLAGLLWSIGNVASMISVQNLGEGVGYSLTQASMLCSGLWGIFYFNEVVSRDLRVKWFASAVLCVTGILLLSYEHQG